MNESPSNSQVAEDLGQLASRGAVEPQNADDEPIIAFSHVGISFDGRAVLEDVSF